jgi:hypothetical protein
MYILSRTELKSSAKPEADAFQNSSYPGSLHLPIGD